MTQPKNANSRWTRRRFLHGLATTTGAAALGGCLPVQNPGCDETFALGDSREEAPVVVIGSGFGGAVAAARLTDAGVPVVLLERGRRWDIVGKADQPFSTVRSLDERSTWLDTHTHLPIGPRWPIRKYVGVLERRRFDGIDVYTGAGYGGGSLVYGGVLLQPRREDFAFCLPTEISYDELDSVYFPRVRERMAATTVPDDILSAQNYTYARVFRAQARNAGLDVVSVTSAFDWAIVRAELNGSIPASTTAGETIVGINSGAKRSLDRNYLRDAESSGLLSVRLLTEVTQIGQQADGRYVVSCDRLSESGCVIGRQTYIANHLFLAAGSVATASLLVRARDTGQLPGVNEHAGTNWSNNGNVHFQRSFVGERTGANQGMPVVYGARAPEGMPAATAENAPLPVGFDCRCLLHLVVSNISTRGTFRYDESSDAVQLHFPQQAREESRAAAAALAQRLVDANGGTIGGPLFPDYVTDFTYHPLGGMPIGAACDHAGRVIGQPNLYVVDGALMPGCAGAVNPALGIAALAERCLDVILDDTDFPT